MVYLAIPVSNLDSESVNRSPVEYFTNLALVYLLTKSGPQGPKPLPKNTCRKILTETVLYKQKFSATQKC